MKAAIDLIVENSTEYPEFRYYISIIKKAEKNISNQPDICVETVKSLLEGVSKSIVERLDPSVSREELDGRKFGVGKLVKRATELLRYNDDVVEDDFVKNCSTVAYSLAFLRNKRGDISHGRAVPKEVKSDERLAFLSFQMAEGIVSYMLESFYRISAEKRLSEVEEMKDSMVDLAAVPDLEQVDYDDNPDFNDILDLEIPWDGKLTYSQALFELYYEDYIIQFDAYRDLLEEDET